MSRVCAVSFDRHGKLHYFDPGMLDVAVGTMVLVPTEDGAEVAECVWAGQETAESYPLLVGLAAEADLLRDRQNRARKAEVTVATRRLVRAHGLPMKVVGVDVRDRAGLVIVFFASPGRVDFRELLRDLSRTLSAKVELRQLSARDEARVQGGIGPCGRDLCCSSFLKDFEPVTMRMVKDQGLPPNPLRISGACGKLLCCLKYEHPLYVAFAEQAPAVGETVTTDDGEGRVVAHDVPREQVVVRVSASGARTGCSLASVCGSRQVHDEGVS